MQKVKNIACNIGLLRGVVLLLVIGASAPTCSAAQYEKIEDVRLISIEFAPPQSLDYYRLDTMASQSQLFAVNFSTSFDLYARTQEFDPYEVRAEMLTGENQCSEEYESYGMSARRYQFSETFIRLNHIFHGPHGDAATANLGVEKPPENRAGTYHFYFGIRFSDEGRFRAGVTQTGPICFYINATSFSGKRITSNLVIIPREMIVQAASAARLGH